MLLTWSNNLMKLMKWAHYGTKGTDTWIIISYLIWKDMTWWLECQRFRKARMVPRMCLWKRSIRHLFPKIANRSSWVLGLIDPDVWVAAPQLDLSWRRLPLFTICRWLHRVHVDLFPIVKVTRDGDLCRIQSTSRK